MGRRKKKANRRRQEEEEANWSALCPDLLRCVFKRLSFTALNRAKSVCSTWHSASRGCVPNQNQIPWLILFPHEDESNKNSSSCVLFVPDDQDKVYTSKDLGVDFSQSRCLTTCGSWLLLLNRRRDLYIVNPLTGERIDLPDNQHLTSDLRYDRVCFRIDNKTKDYLVVMLQCCSVFTKKGYKKWHDFPHLDFYGDFAYNQKDQKLYVHYPNDIVDIWDLSGDNPHKDRSLSLDPFYINHYDFPSFLNDNDDELYWDKLRGFTTRTAVTVSGDILMVSSIVQDCKTWYFRIYKTNLYGNWVKVKSLGNEALIYDMGITVVANGISGIKRNSIYFSGVNHGRDDPHHIFVYDLTTHKMEPLPQCVLSSIPFSDARWFFPCY
ncbi:F-box domain [Arabidopsis suecica]|uniref:F-box domain n=1 Tax=Arabidopsis suecica TaxID=45249 RepID=A0A8T2AZC8_ARASU|nr:F-box domain [Arabidopsis suecica]